jgi:hypothetical protein
MSTIDSINVKVSEPMMAPDGQPIAVLPNQLNLVSPLREPEKIALQESIQVHGVKIPIMISLGPTRGRIIDGFNRWEICQQLGMSCPVSFELFQSVDEEETMALGLNVQRRQLDELSAGLINMRLLELRGITRGRKGLNGVTVSDVAREAGQTERTFYRRIEFAKLVTRPDCSDILQAYQAEEVTVTEALTLSRARKKAADAGMPHTPDPNKSLKDMVAQLKTRKQITPIEQARMEAFTEGVRWGFEAGAGNKAEPDWILEQLDSWRRSSSLRDQAEAKQPETETPNVSEMDNPPVQPTLEVNED